MIKEYDEKDKKIKRRIESVLGRKRKRKIRKKVKKKGNTTGNKGRKDRNMRKEFRDGDKICKGR